jgi:transcriptional regulator with XRE-family HTH domain
MNRLKEFREKALLTQEELARQVGISFVTLNRWENDKQRPSFRLLKQLARVLKVKPEELHLRGDGHEKE